MGTTLTSDISVARNEVVKKGLTYAPERSLLAFPCPACTPSSRASHRE